VTSWYAPLARAIPALVLAAVVTFSADHSPALGLISFRIFAAATGAVITRSWPGCNCSPTRTATSASRSSFTGSIDAERLRGWDVIGLPLPVVRALHRT